MSFDHVMATACTWTITLLYIYLCVWGLNLRLNNINYSYWYFLSSTIIISLYWTSKPPISSSITTSEYLICDKNLIPTSWNHSTQGFFSLTLLLSLTKGFVATTRWNSTHNMLTSAKLSVSYLVVEITRGLDKKPSLYWYSIYTTGSWSVLQQ